MTTESIITTCSSRLYTPSPDTIEYINAHVAGSEPVMHTWCTEDELTAAVDFAPRLTSDLEDEIGGYASSFTLDSVLIYSYVMGEKVPTGQWT